MAKTFTVIGFVGDEAIDLYHSTDDIECVFSKYNQQLIEDGRIFSVNFDTLQERISYFDGIKDAKRFADEPMEFYLLTSGVDSKEDDVFQETHLSNLISHKMLIGDYSQKTTEARNIIAVLENNATKGEVGFFKSRFGDDKDRAIERLIEIQIEATRKILEEEYSKKFKA